MQLGGGLGQLGGHAQVLHIAADDLVGQKRGDVPPRRGGRMRAADEHAGRGRQRLRPQQRCAGFGRAGANEGAVTMPAL